MRVITPTLVLLFIGVFLTPWAAALQDGTLIKRQDGGKDKTKSKSKFPSFKRGWNFGFKSKPKKKSSSDLPSKKKSKSKKRPKFNVPFFNKSLKSKSAFELYSESSTEPVPDSPSESTFKRGAQPGGTVRGDRLHGEDTLSSAVAEGSNIENKKDHWRKLRHLLRNKRVRDSLKATKSIIFLRLSVRQAAFKTLQLFKCEIEKAYPGVRYGIANGQFDGASTASTMRFGYPAMVGYESHHIASFNFANFPAPRLFILDTTHGVDEQQLQKFKTTYADQIRGDLYFRTNLSHVDKPPTKDVVDGGSLSHLRTKQKPAKFSRRLLKLIWKSDTRDALKKANSIIFYRPSNLSAGNAKLIQDETRKVAPGKVYLLGAEEPLFVADGLKSSFTVVHSDAIDLDSLPQPRVFITNTNAVGASNDLRDFYKTYRKRVGKEDILIDVDLEEEAE